MTFRRIRPFAAALVALAAASFLSVALASTFDVVHVFDCATGCGPSPVVAGPAGTVYGLTNSGGALGGGVLYAYDGQSYTVLHEFADGQSAAGLTEGGGVLYGLMGGSPERFWAWDPAGGFRVLPVPSPFQGAYYPAASADGHIYFGQPDTDGTVDAVARYDVATGLVSVLHTFAPGDGWIEAPLAVQGRQVFGTTAHGPWAIDGRTGRTRFYQSAYPQWTVWLSIGLADDELVGVANNARDVTFYQFDRTRGYQPFPVTLPGFEIGGLTPNPLHLGADGKLYGVTNQGGQCLAGVGEVYQVDPVTHAQADVHDFCPGWFPSGAPVAGPGGALYGIAGGQLYRLAP